MVLVDISASRGISGGYESYSMVDGDETLIWSLQTASNEGEHLMVDVPRKQGQRCQFFWHERVNGSSCTDTYLMIKL
ncbi:Transducin/WD40 repeat-like superfamily protein [Zea mays]|uniref:Transducin/WD40 repeat-like superfamily protein n=1 Tax=Zea mays TaxID=4577 RepID=A0A1D6MYV1_MAIZE|nr:Transducin/WD40 repeat-like superfamily protein [Zea mays]